jgi:hypothetical protein
LAQSGSSIKTGALASLALFKPAAVGPNKPRLRRLSAEELAAKCSHGVSFHCTEKYRADHRCAARGAFLLELYADDPTPEDIDEDLGISLHALTSIDIANTMKLRIRVHGHDLVALVDTRSTHTFIREDLVPRLVLPFEERNGLLVKVANGERVTSSDVCRRVTMTVGAEDFGTTFYALPLDGFDVVLGIHVTPQFLPSN